MVIDNLTLAKEPNPWSVASLRNALSLFIDRQKIADGYGGTTIPSSTMFVEYGSMAPYIDALKSEGHGLPTGANISSAEQLLMSESFAKGTDGFFVKGGVPPTAKIAVNESVPADVDGAKALKQQLDVRATDKLATCCDPLVTGE